MLPAFAVGKSALRSVALLFALGAFPVALWQVPKVQLQAGEVEGAGAGVTQHQRRALWVMRLPHVTRARLSHID